MTLTRTLATALALTLPLPALADFNAAPPNATGQAPAFEGQTRAPVLADDVALETTVVAEGLNHPWALAALPDGSWLVTERAGALRHLDADGKLSGPITGLPEVDARGQGGLLDVAIDKDFDQTRRIWWTFAEPRGEGKNATAVATGLLSADMSKVEGAEVIFQQQPAWDSDKHFGSRLVFDGKGGLFVTTGERSTPGSSPLAQDPSTHIGKVVRIDPKGGAAAGNPTVEGWQPEIFAIGFRNVQAAALGPDGALWTVEHGPKGGDELNRVEPGKNYGWPVISYGVNYDGSPVDGGKTAQDGMEQPLYFWDPVIAPSGMAVYDGAMFPEWRGNLLIGALGNVQAMVRLTLDGTKVTGEARHLQGIGRVRDVAVAADGAVWLVTDEDNGKVIRVTRK